MNANLLHQLLTRLVPNNLLFISRLLFQEEGSFCITSSQQGTYNEDGSVVLSAAEVLWQAKSILDLNDCDKESIWQLQAELDDGATWKTNSLLPGCQALTPNFSKIGSGAFSAAE